MVCVVLTPPEAFLKFGAYFALVLTLIFISRVPIGYVLVRVGTIIPFVVLVAAFVPFFKEGEVAGSWSFGNYKLKITYSGLWVLWNVSCKALLSCIVMIILISTTRFPLLLKGLEHLKFPKVFVMLLAFMYRYIFVLLDEGMRMSRAMVIRSTKDGGIGTRIGIKTRATGWLISSLFVRAYERSERVYQAMCSRGFGSSGEIGTLGDLKFAREDYVFLSAFLSFLFVVRILV